MDHMNWCGRRVSENITFASATKFYQMFQNSTDFLSNSDYYQQFFLYIKSFNLCDFIYYGIILLIILIIQCIIWWLLFIPMDWRKDLTDIGFYHVKSIRKDRTSVKNTINRIRRLRDIGDKLPPPYPNGWFGIAETKDVKKGQAISVNALGENFVVFRSENGTINVLDAYCPHLGANLGVGGIVRDDCIECPFHQWAFRGSDGECINIPYSKSGIVPKSAKVKKWNACEVNGAIFVWYHSENIEPNWQLPIVSEVDSGKWIFSGRNEFLINCHIQEIPENGADISHLNAVHGPSMLAGSDLRFSRIGWTTFTTHAWDACWQANSEEDNMHRALMKLKHSIRFFNKFELFTMHVNANQIGPGYVQLQLQSSYGPFVILQTVTPVEPLVQKVIHRFYLPKSLVLIAKFAVWGESIMFERDMMVWNHKKFMDNPCLIKEDKMVKAYRNWYSQFYSVNSKSFRSAKENLDW